MERLIVYRANIEASAGPDGYILRRLAARSARPPRLASSCGLLRATRLR